MDNWASCAGGGGGSSRRGLITCNLVRRRGKQNVRFACEENGAEDVMLPRAGCSAVGRKGWLIEARWSLESARFGRYLHADVADHWWETGADDNAALRASRAHAFRDHHVSETRIHSQNSGTHFSRSRQAVALAVFSFTGTTLHIVIYVPSGESYRTHLTHTASANASERPHLHVVFSPFQSAG